MSGTFVDGQLMPLLGFVDLSKIVRTPSLSSEQLNAQPPKAKEMLQARYVRVLTQRHIPFVFDRAKPKLPSPSKNG
jgi:hypothetical protein